MTIPFTYSFNGFGGYDNCTLCDEEGHVNDYTRLADGKAVMLCKVCEKREKC